MSNTIEKTTKESLIILGRYYGKEASAQYKWNDNGDLSTGTIDHNFLYDFHNNNVVSFRITSLRKMEQMTDLEKIAYLSQRNSANYDTAESIHYLDSIGVTTDENLLKTIIIKD